MENSSQDSKKYAYRIYTIIKNGPLDKSGANELTDFIIPPDEVITNQITFEEWVQTHSNQEIILSFYSLLTKKFRDLKIKTNPLGSKEGVLGVSVQRENWTVANKKILHIISVNEDSFAQKELGLIPFEDYIVGVKCKSSPIIPLNNDDFSPLEILGEVIRKNKGNPVKFYIYNRIKGPRDITATIGDDYYFTLGCDGAFGALHMFPSIDMENAEQNNAELNNDSNIKESKEEKDIEDIKEKIEIIKDKNENNINKIEENKLVKDNASDNNNNNLNQENIEEINNKTISTEVVSQNQENKEQNQKGNQNENIEDNNNTEIKIVEKEIIQISNNNDSKPSDNNINKIVEEIKVVKELEDNNSPKKEEKEEIQLIEEKITSTESDNKEMNEEIKAEKIDEIKEEIIEEKKEKTIEEIKEIKKEDLLDNINIKLFY